MGRVIARGLAGFALVATCLAPLSADAAGSWCTGRGVNVVVDFNGLGGGVQRGCDPSGAHRVAWSVFQNAGFRLTPVQSDQNFVCRVSDAPNNNSCARTPPTNAYWSLWLANGRGGGWSYSSLGARSLKVPNGGFVAFSWQGSNTQSPPSARPVNRSSEPAPEPKPDPEPKPEPKPTPKPTPKPSPGPEPQQTQQPAPTASSAQGQADDGTSPSGGGGPNGPSRAESPRAGGPPDAKADGKADNRAPRSAKDGDKGRAKQDDRRDAETEATAQPTTEPKSDASENAAPVAASGGPRDGELVTGQAPVVADGLPVWIPAGVVLLLSAGTVMVLLRRRRAGGPV